MLTLPFTKMHGLGNDFIVIEGSTFASVMTPDFAKKICDRRFGIGADQILWLRKPQNSVSSSHDIRMEILNADGSTAEMCGNGIRAVALYLNRHCFPEKKDFQVETLAGTILVSLTEVDKGNEKTSHARVNMGTPVLGKNFSKEGEAIEVLVGGQRKEFRFYEVSMGNPHAVIFVESLLKTPVEEFGPLLEKHPRFPQRTNVEFVEIKNRNEIQVKVWERGAGITLACGTGACAAAVASIELKKVEKSLNVHLLGGALQVGWEGGTSGVIMEGPAEEVFRGEITV